MIQKLAPAVQEGFGVTRLASSCILTPDLFAAVEGVSICIYAADCYANKILHCSVPQENKYTLPHSFLSCSDELEGCPSYPSIS